MRDIYVGAPLSEQFALYFNFLICWQLPPQSGKKSLYLETTTTPTPTHTQPQQQQQQQNLPSPTLSADGRRVVRRVGSVTEILDKFQSHQRHSSQPLQEENLFSAVGGIHSSHNSSHNKQPLNQSTRAHSMVNLNYQNPPQSQGQTHPNQKHTQPSQSSGGRYTASSANLSEEELHLVAMIMKRTGLDRPQAIQVYLSQRSTWAFSYSQQQPILIYTFICSFLKQLKIYPY